MRVCCVLALPEAISQRRCLLQPSSNPTLAGAQRVHSGCTERVHRAGITDRVRGAPNANTDPAYAHPATPKRGVPICAAGSHWSRAGTYCSTVGRGSTAAGAAAGWWVGRVSRVGWGGGIWAVRGSGAEMRKQAFRDRSA